MFLEQIKDFVRKMKRLPLLDGDSLEYMNENDEISYKSGRNAIKETFGDDFDVKTDLIEQNIINYEEIDELLDLKQGTSKRIIEGRASVNTEGRREIEYFFNHDFLKDKDKDNGFNKKCAGCKKKCKQHYYVDLIHCRNYKKK